MKTYYRVVTSLVATVLTLSAGAANALGLGKNNTPPITGTIDPVSGFLTTSAPVQHSYIRVGSQYVYAADGTTAFTANIVVNGVNRRYVVLRPNPAPASAPMLLLLHPNSTSPENMANLTEVSDFALTQGFWAVMPEAVSGRWRDDPSTSPNDDVRFISALIDSLSTQGVDPTRVYAAGYSNGGFMTERLSCELSDKIAAFAVDSAEMRGTLISTCAPVRQRSKMYVLGTADPVVAYDGVYSGTANGLWGALDSVNWWSAAIRQQCGGLLANSLPNRATNDGTTVQQTLYTGCTGNTALQLFTVTGGGHAWPGGSTVGAMGPTSQDIDATGLVWLFVRDARR